jgi:hypothetical protein
MKIGKKSFCSRWMDQVASQVHKALKPLSYHKQGLTFKKEAESGVIQVINFQLSHYNFAKDCKYYVNLGVYVPEISETLYGKSLSVDKVKEYHCHFRARLSEFVPENFLSVGIIDPKGDWKLSEDTVTLGQELTALLQKYGLPFLEERRSPETILQQWMNIPDEQERIRDMTETPNIVVLLARHGKIEIAEKVLHSLHNKFIVGRPNYSKHILELGQKLGIAIQVDS